MWVRSRGGCLLCKGWIIVDLRISETLSIHSQPLTPLAPLIRGELFVWLIRGETLIRGTLKISRRLKLLVNVPLFLVFTIVAKPFVTTESRTWRGRGALSAKCDAQIANSEPGRFVQLMIAVFNLRARQSALSVQAEILNIEGSDHSSVDNRFADRRL